MVDLLSAVAIDDEDLEFGGGGVLVRLLDEVVERLHEALAGRAVFGGEEDNHVGCLGADEGIIDCDLFIRIEGSSFSNWHVWVSSLIFAFFCDCRVRFG